MIDMLPGFPEVFKIDQSCEAVLDLMIQKRKRLSSLKRYLQARGYEEFVESGDSSLMKKTKQLAAQLAILDLEINFIRESNKGAVRLHGIKTGDFKRMAENSYALGLGKGR